MNTIVAGLILVLIFYSAQTILVGWMFGWITTLAYAISLPISATWDFRYADRLRRAIARVRTYIRFRHDRRLHDHLLRELAWLRADAIELDALLGIS